MQKILLILALLGGFGAQAIAADETENGRESCRERV